MIQQQLHQRQQLRQRQLLSMPPLASGRVLIWLTDYENNFGDTFGLLAGIYTSMGLTVHTNANWTTTLDDYKLIHWPYANANPSWWSQISGYTWVGRLHVCTENNVTDSTSRGYVNGISSVTGVSVISDAIDGPCGDAGSAETDDLTAGCSSILFAFTSEVSGGDTVLSKTITGTKPWLIRSKPSGSSVDFVVSGDTSHIVDSCPTHVPHNAPLLENMWNVAP